MTESYMERLVEQVVLVAIAIGKAVNEKRSGDVEGYTDRIRKLVREALAE